MKVSNCFLLNALVYVALASFTLAGKETNTYPAATSRNEIEGKPQIEAGYPQDLKTELLFRFQ